MFQESFDLEPFNSINEKSNVKKSICNAPSMFELGPEPKEIVAFLDPLISKISSTELQLRWREMSNSSWVHEYLKYLVDSYQKGWDQSQEFAKQLLENKTFSWWDIHQYRTRVEKNTEHISEGQFSKVLGKFGLNRVGGTSSLFYSNHEELFPEKQGGVFLDALTNATVSNFGTGYPLHLGCAHLINTLFGGGQGSPYHPGPLLKESAEQILQQIPIFPEGAKLAWFNSGGAAVSVGIAASEQYLHQNRKEIKKRKALCFDNAYHGNIENRAGRLTAGINDSFHAEDLNCYVINYPYQKAQVEPALSLIENYLKRDELSCIVFESTQGDGGGVSLHPEFFVGLLKLSWDFHVPLICDEVQSGFGRSGRCWTSNYLIDHWRESKWVKECGYPTLFPMIWILAKSITNGVCPASCVILPKEYAVLERARGLNTYSAHPMGLVGAIATTSLMRETTFKAVQEKRKLFDAAFDPYRFKSDWVKEVRGNGLHLFIETEDSQLLQIELLGKYRILTGTVGRDALRVHAPINAPNEVWQALGQCIGKASYDISRGDVSRETLYIRASGGPSGLASR